MNELEDPQSSPSPSRRTVVKTAAWAAPAVALSFSAPAAAASVPVSALTVKFTQPVYSTQTGGQYTFPKVAANVLDKDGIVAGAMVTFSIEAIESSGGSEPAEGGDGDDESDGTDASAAFGSSGGPTTAVAFSDVSGVATPEVIYAGNVGGILRVTATATATIGGSKQSATAEAYLQILVITTTKVPSSAGYGGTYALGTGSTRNNPIPAHVALPASAGSVTLLGAGVYRAGFALDEAGTLWSWGSDTYRTQAVRRTQKVPVAFTNLPMAMSTKDIVQLEGTYYAMFALTSSGEVWGWGYNLEGQFADGSRNGIYRETPVRISFPETLPPVKKLAGGQYNMHALLEDGTLWNWGYGRNGSLGNNNAAVNRALTPTQVKGFPEGRTVVDVAGRNDGASAVLDDGSVYSWGLNSNYQIGDGSNTRRLVPTLVPSISGAQRVYSNYWNVGVVLADGTCRLWGRSAYYNLGNGSTTNPKVPVDPGLRNVAALSWGLETGHALLTDGSVYGWGYNGNYETGTGERGNIKTPRPVPGIGRVKQIAQSQYSTYFLPA